MNIPATWLVEHVKMIFILGPVSDPWKVGKARKEKPNT